MSSSLTDYQLANAAAGFTIGFGILTTWEAIKQTRQLKTPSRSVYIYMVWGEIIANLGILISCWLLLNNKIAPSVPTYFFILLFWCFEIHFILQLVVNRLSIVVGNRRLANRVRWGVAVIITIVNIGVFCIFIPSHLVPPPNQTIVTINKYWDKSTKFIILFIDASLNFYFLRTVNERLVRNSGLTKYRPLASFNAKLMAVSVLMDVMIIGLMFIPNQLVFTQFHPVAYMVKLNIEMSMAKLIRRLATSKENDFQIQNHNTSSDGEYGNGAVGLAYVNRRGGSQGFEMISSASVGVGMGREKKISEDETRIVVTEEYEIRRE